MAAIGDVHRSPSARHLVSYLGLDPRVRQPGEGHARHGHISKHGSRSARHALVETASSAARVPGPLHAFGERVRARGGSQVASVAVAQELAVVAWHPLTCGEDLRLRPALTDAARSCAARARRRCAALPRPPRRGAGDDLGRPA
jgi:hypothetical protein